MQQLCEIEEIVIYKRLVRDKRHVEATQNKANMLQMFNKRLLGSDRNVDDWSRLLAVRSMVFAPHESVTAHLKCAKLYRKRERWVYVDTNFRIFIKILVACISLLILCQSLYIIAKMLFSSCFIKPYCHRFNLAMSIFYSLGVEVLAEESTGYVNF